MPDKTINLSDYGKTVVKLLTTMEKLKITGIDITPWAEENWGTNWAEKYKNQMAPKGDELLEALLQTMVRSQEKNDATQERIAEYIERAVTAEAGERRYKCLNFFLGAALVVVAILQLFF